uniref:Uncharacterized protein n=1 Tax=Anguilla anguilla TaxID=7936 RepID=A0A0E9UU39_ANGAN
MGCTIYIFHNNALLVRNGEIDRQMSQMLRGHLLHYVKLLERARKDLLQHTSFP